MNETKRQSMHKPKNLPLLCGVIDAALILATALIVAVMADKTPMVFIKQNPWIAYGVTIPFCILVGWRGLMHSKRLMAGQSGWSGPAIEGFLAGFLTVPLIAAIGLVQERMADGPPYPSLGNAIDGEWLAFSLLVLRSAFLIGLTGTVLGLLLSKVNRILIRKRTS
jgi:hypothetical protein